jgi:TRAP-type mannitol/chloroaromatic compound transport system permease large subunit
MDMNKKISINFGGCGFTLAIIFLVLKLTHVIDWAWVWIFAPVWIPLALAAAILLIYFLVLIIVAIVTAIRGY